MLPVPLIGQGSWQLELEDRASALAAVRRGIALGLTHIDTAEMYGSGSVESLLSEALEGQRDEVFLVSKVLPYNASREGTIGACERSLRRLKTDRLDLYLLHWPGSHPLEETIAAFEQLVQDGKILRWGLSNFDVEELEAAYRVAGPGRISCNQVLYHLDQRAIEHRVIPWCRDHDVDVVGYSPFGSGSFPRNTSVLEEIGRAHGASPRQVALRFLVRQVALGFLVRQQLYTIVKAAKLPHVEDNADALDLTLSTAELARIAAAHPLGPLPAALPMI